MTPFEIYRTYVGVKLHFNSMKYDYIEMSGAVRVSGSSYDRRRDKYYFKKLSERLKNKDVVPFFVSQFIKDNNMWVGEISDSIDNSMSIYRKWIGSIQSINSRLNEELNLIQEFLDDRELTVNMLFTITNGVSHPVIFRFYLEGMISIETMIYLNRKYKFVDFFNGELIDPIWEHHSMIISKYESFLRKTEFKPKIDLIDFQH